MSSCKGCLYWNNSKCDRSAELWLECIHKDNDRMHYLAKAGVAYDTYYKAMGHVADTPCPKCDFINCLCEDEDDMTVKFKAGGISDRAGRSDMGLAYSGYTVYENKVDDRIYRHNNDIYVPPKLLEVLRNAQKAGELVAHLRDGERKNQVSQADNYFDNLSDRIGVPELDEFLKKEEMEL